MHGLRPRRTDRETTERMRRLAETLRTAVGATLVEISPSDDEPLRAVSPEDALTEADALRAAVARHHDRSDDHVVTEEAEGRTLLLARYHTLRHGRTGVIGIALPSHDPGSIEQATDLAELLRGAVEIAADDMPPDERRALDELVTSIADDLMPVRLDTLGEAIRHTLQRLQEFFAVDTVFLRRNDHERGMTVLIDEWPRRDSVPDPDPIGEVPFTADPVWGAIRDLRQPFVQRPATSPNAYQERIRSGSGIDGVSLAMVPMVRGDVTDGVLGLIQFGDRPWSRDETSALQAIASLMTQLRARVEAEQRLTYQAYHDDLTGLPNRRWLLEELDRRNTSAGEHPVAVLFLDMDNLKDLNDVLGHQLGDRLLRTVADRVREALGPNDVAGRIGGDEFLVLLDCPSDEQEAADVAERLVRLTSVPVEIGGYQLWRTVSVGVASARGGEIGADVLLGQADAALHRAKTLGRNQVAVFDQQLQAEVDERFDTEVLLRRAVDDEELELHYQPELDLRTGRVTAVEALVRWNHPARGLLPAAAFIEVAEASGMTVELGRWVLAEAARQAADWSERYPELELPVRVNVSPLQLRNRGLIDSVADALAEHRIPGRLLSLEITEYAVMQDVERSAQTLHDLREMGVRIALDDFGTGYSSMAQLKHLPLDYLKIDRSFVAGLGSDAADASIIDSIAQLAVAFDLELVAEGVESVIHVDRLLEVGCNLAQGYLLCHPVPPAELEELLESGVRHYPGQPSYC